MPSSQSLHPSSSPEIGGCGLAAEPIMPLAPRSRQRRRRRQRLERRTARLRLVAAARSFAFAHGRSADPLAVARMVAHVLQSAAERPPAPVASASSARPCGLLAQAAPQECKQVSEDALEDVLEEGAQARGLACGETLHALGSGLALPHHPLVVLYRPEIPPNAGSVARLCAAFRMPFAIVGPIAFELSARAFRRAGLDYWPWVELTYYADWKAFAAAEARRRFVFVETSGTAAVASFAFGPGDALIFGSETSGLPPELLGSAVHPRPHEVVRIPMWQDQVRSINLANAVSIVASHALNHPSVAAAGLSVAASTPAGPSN